MSIYDRLVSVLRKVPPFVKATPLNRNEYLTEIADEPQFIEHIEGDYKSIALELWQIIEDIEKAEMLTSDRYALSSLVKELTSKRFIYLNDEKIKELIQYQLNKQKNQM